MTFERAWGLPEQHLMPDAVVAFVDGELGRTAHDRAVAHLAGCRWCAAEINAQRQARAAVRAADVPSMPAGLLASLRAIPQEVELPATPDGLAVTEDGQLVAIQRPERAQTTGFGSSTPLGSSAKLGEGRAVLGRRSGKRAAQGAGVVVSGLVLGALALVNTTGAAPTTERAEPAVPIVGGGVEPVGFVGNRIAHVVSPSFGLVSAR
ncbi:zf-HC2 domain-containing protein [Actinokineospora iranica]|uniref:Putative zinc-finger n=1 Tax=Actinokineospora iranica TaxID=1271860 RepID=A0A1G6R807_9PSEU|nr:zf-HC2 domain-containing protein [Actinokineospora iranica]SDD00026.1 Putative zinc-finger [Actinokineospora iranica]